MQKFSFLSFTKRASTLTREVWAEDSKTGLGIKIGHRRQKLWRSPHVKLMGNPAVPLREFIYQLFWLVVDARHFPFCRDFFVITIERILCMHACVCNLTSKNSAQQKDLMWPYRLCVFPSSCLHLPPLCKSHYKMATIITSPEINFVEFLLALFNFWAPDSFLLILIEVPCSWF